MVYTWLILSICAIIATFITFSNIHAVSGAKTLGIIVGDVFSILTFFVLLKHSNDSDEIQLLSEIMNIIWVIICIVMIVVTMCMLSTLIDTNTTSVVVLCILFGDLLTGMTVYTLFKLYNEIY